MGHIGACHSGLLAVALFVTACGGSDALGESTGVPLSQAPAVAVDAYCHGFGACCASHGYSFDAAACQSLLSASITADAICPAPSLYDAVAADQCYSELTAALSSCNAGVSSADSACRRMCKGTKAVGSSCSRGTECAAPGNGTASCAIIGNATTGICTTQTLVKLGETCNETCTNPGINGATCDFRSTADAGSTEPLEARVCSRNAGLYCSPDLTCKNVVPLGKACPNAECELGSHCSLSTLVCVTDLDVGGSCAVGNECASGAYCNTDHICAAKKAAGEACQLATECTGVCDSSGHCVGSNSQTLNVTAASCAGTAS